MNINGYSSGLNAMLSSLNMKGNIKSPNFKFNQSVYDARFTPSDKSFVAPNWSNIWSKETPEMSEEEYIKAIQEQAESDYANGINMRDRRRNGNIDLLNSFVQVASPDRKAVYDDSMSKTGGKLNINGVFFDNQDRLVMMYAEQEQKWMTFITKEEGSRLQQFNKIYNDAYAAAMKKGQSQGGATASSYGVDIRA